MKQPLLLILLLTLSCFASGQSDALRVEPGNVVKEVVVDDLDKGYQDITNITVTNTSRRTIQLVQNQSVGKKPRAWEYGMFSRKKVSAPYNRVEAAREAGRPVRLNPGQSASFYLVLQPNSSSGEGTVEIRFSDLTVPGRVLAKATFSTKLLRRPRVDAGNAPPLSPNNATNNGTGRPTPKAVNLFPNPARDRFFVEAPPGTQLGRIEVSNTLGKRLKQFEGKPGPNGFEIEDLPDGLYLISIYDNQGKKLKTLRLLHRRFGA
ncbi:MAG: T9SS type A sorting domain-containing protein [Bacteroidota bacterium]